MQLYCVIGTFPDIDCQLAGYREFINYFDGGCLMTIALKALNCCIAWASASWPGASGPMH